MIADAFVHAHLRVLTESGDGQQSIIYSEELPWSEQELLFLLKDALAVLLVAILRAVW